MHADRKLIYRAGTIPYKFEAKQIKMLFMKPSDPVMGGDEFQISKGKLEDGEDSLTAALREAYEEVGLLKEAIVGSVESVGTFLGRTDLFICKTSPTAPFCAPGFETGETRWMTVDEFERVGRDLHKPLVRAAYNRICVREADFCYSSTDGT